MQISVFIAILAGLAALFWLAAPRANDTRTAMQRIVWLLYVWARFWWCVAAGLDAAVVRFRAERGQLEIRPLSEEA